MSVQNYYTFKYFFDRKLYFQVCGSFKLDRRRLKVGFFHCYLEMIVQQPILQVFMLTLPPNVRSSNLLVWKVKLISKHLQGYYHVTIPSSGSTATMYGFFSGKISFKNASALAVESYLKFLITNCESYLPRILWLRRNFKICKLRKSKP